MSKEYRVLVCGSRDWTDEKRIHVALETLCASAILQETALVIVEGGAQGADSIAGKWAEFNLILHETYPADWKKHGKRAGFIRNSEMLEKNIDLVLAFQKNKSRGTQDTIDKARKKGIRVVVVEE